MSDSDVRPAEPPELPALDVDGVGAITIGTAAWAVLTVIAVLRRDDLKDNGHGWWLWVAVTGTVLGLLAIPYLLRRRQRGAHRGQPDNAPET